MNYLSYEFNPSRVYIRQVTDNCRFMEQTSGAGVRLVIFLPLRKYRRNKKRVLEGHERTWVIPMLFGPRKWKLNYILLFFAAIFLNSGRVISDGIIATSMALRLRKRGIVRRVGYDAKSAYSAEWKEYDTIPFPEIIRMAEKLEREAIQKSDYRIAASEALVQHWREKYNYDGSRHIIVPGTLDSSTNLHLPEKGLLHESRTLRGYLETDIILLYSGSFRGPQGSGALDAFLVKLMESNPNVKVLFLTESSLSNLEAMRLFPGRITKDYVRTNKLAKVLATADYGLLIREPSTASKVASPTKFGEYLTCGLPVIISGNLGDFSDFVGKHDCGIIVDPYGAPPEIKRITHDQKEKISEISRRFFLKGIYWELYSSIFNRKS
jgi:hypothetical protein